MATPWQLFRTAKQLRRAAATACTALALSSAAGAENGAALYGTCIACHGSDGAGNTALGAPAIAGQQESYLLRQLRHFRDGTRGGAAGDAYGAQMVPFAAQLADDAAVDAVAAYVAALPATPVAEPAAGDMRRGASLYNGNCGACHGGSAEGNVALNAPRLAGLDAAYLRRQYANYAAGVRGANPEDRFGRQMAMMATSLPDDRALDDVIAYIHSLGAAR